MTEKLSYKAAEALLTENGYVIFGCEGQRDDGTWIFQARSPNATGVQQVKLSADGKHIWTH